MENEKLQKILQVIIILYCILLAISGIRMIAGSDGVTVMLSIFIGCAKIALAILQGYFAVSIEKIDSGIMLKGFALSGVILLISFNFIFAIFSFAFAVATKLLPE